MKKRHYLIIMVEMILFGIVSARAATTIPAEGVLYNNNTVKTAIDNLVTKVNVGTATSSDILNGKTALVMGKTVTGSMTNNGAISKTDLAAGSSYTIPAGYHNGSGKITAKSLSDQTTATAVASDILNGKTAYVNGVKITGTNDGGYKIYKFSALPATVKAPYEFTGSWVAMGYRKYYDCSSGSCTVDDSPASFSVDLGIPVSEVVGGVVQLTTDASSKAFRYSMGYSAASSEGKAQYWYLDELTSKIAVSEEYLRIYPSSNSNNYYTYARVNSQGKVTFSVATYRSSHTNGTTKNAYYTNQTNFYLSGYVIYK